MSVVRVSHPTRIINTSITLPASKSISNRALLMQAFNPAIALHNLSAAHDTSLMREALQHNNPIKQLGNAGTCMRFLTAYYAGVEGEVTLQCDARMMLRPIKNLVDALKQLGAQITYLEQEGYPPLHIKGARLKGGRISIDASQSSQFASGLMIAAPYFENDTHIVLGGHIVSDPYIDMTAGLMQHFGAGVSREGNNIYIRAGKGYEAGSLRIEPDWSAAAFWYEIAALSDECRIELKDLDPINSLQGDAATALYMAHFGVRTETVANGIVLHKTKALSDKLDINLSNQPDLVPALAATAAALQVPATIHGISHLAIKESNRLEAVTTELRKCGAHISQSDDGLKLGSKTLQQAAQPIRTYADHRMAMAFAPLALRLGSIVIEAPEVTAKSYPDFWNHLQQAGFVLA